MLETDAQRSLQNLTEDADFSHFPWNVNAWRRNLRLETSGTRDPFVSAVEISISILTADRRADPIQKYSRYGMRPGMIDRTSGT